MLATPYWRQFDFQSYCPRPCRTPDCSVGKFVAIVNKGCWGINMKAGGTCVGRDVSPKHPWGAETVEISEEALSAKAPHLEAPYLEALPVRPSRFLVRLPLHSCRLTADSLWRTLPATGSGPDGARFSVCHRP